MGFSLRTGFVFTMAFALLAFPADFAKAQKLPKLFPFNKKDALNEWEEKVFKNKVLYTVKPAVPDGQLSAESNSACSGLIYRVKFNVNKTPMISWEWKVTKFPDKLKTQNEGGWIEKDDYAARVYIIFPSMIFTETQTLEYIWSETDPEGTIMTSPYFKNIKLIVIESGRENMDKWVFEERNILEDFTKAFGKSPSRNVGAISLMTDTDNTMSTAEAFYKDIKVGYSYEEPK
ncbi:MAG: DUF3047 domain-containing protein [Candidatus Omnitrophica bacterium]|nr:DUF3047 domain-containing protein [Candidatus Omnitrophota bacterium]